MLSHLRQKDARCKCLSDAARKKKKRTTARGAVQCKNTGITDFPLFFFYQVWTLTHITFDSGMVKIQTARQTTHHDKLFRVKSRNILTSTDMTSWCQENNFFMTFTTDRFFNTNLNDLHACAYVCIWHCTASLQKDGMICIIIDKVIRQPSSRVDRGLRLFQPSWLITMHKKTQLMHCLMRCTYPLHMTSCLLFYHSWIKSYWGKTWFFSPLNISW